MTFDFAALAESAQRLAGRSDELRRRIDELHTSAATDDERVTVRWNGSGLAGVDLDPRAMRMPAAELGALITATAGRAREEFERAVRTLREEFADAAGGGASEPPGAEETADFINDMGSIMQSAVQESTAIIDGMRRALQQR
ncbi:YbaB/EbfC family nucleoid-associated protein [Actinomadura parmotrematis]|uniref:YbaB/EbfC family nucleoid-associated protein n=1 Tax=Actinomadura parmotrematis TaxID=2864039 RepID=A0ABS7FL81_9ACTN|nr:YbaB/EbfC family nucleoid-associated protein [Actinomadura parmotrematis]MBW8481130.1 YbaB/EbfC family nucleoid-associated protein [Actinomadura parmotrematis]